MDNDFVAVLNDIDRLIAKLDRQISRLRVAGVGFGLLVSSGLSGACYFQGKINDIQEVKSQLLRIREKLSRVFDLAPVAELELPKGESI